MAVTAKITQGKSIDTIVKSAMSDLALRPMCRDDAESIACLHAELDASPWNTDQWIEAYEHAADGWVISSSNAEGSEQIVGYAIFRAVCEQAELLNFGIRREYQGRGLGKEFLSATISLLPTKVDELLLEVRRSNVPAIGLYEKLGFNEVTVRRDYYPIAGGGREDAIVMGKVIEAR